MRVGIDARTVYAATRRGTGKNLIDLYSTLATRHPSWEFVMFHQASADNDPFAQFANVRQRRIDIRGDRWNLWQDVRLPLAARADKLDVLHCPANTAPRLSLTPTVLTVHDLIPQEMAPDATSTHSWLRRVARSAQAARRIVTPSQYSRRTILRHLAVPAEKITVNHWAADRRCHRIENPATIASVREKYGLPASGPYVLAFGAADPRKNTATLLQAWARLRLSRALHGAILLVVGLQNEALATFERMLKEISIARGSCLLRGFADEQDIPALLSGATALCYPSRSEGFGLPILDAFACGTPVITSCTTSLPEVAGGAAILIDPHDPEAIRRAIVEVLTSEECQQQLRTAGYKRLESFSWDRCAATAAGVLLAAARADERGRS